MTDTATPPPSYRPGDRVRVLVDEPYSTELVAGDIITVIQQTTKIEGGTEIEVVQVSTNAGTRWLGLDVVEHFTGVYVPAEPDEVVDAQLRALLDADEELAAFAREADTALGATDAKVSAQLDPKHADELEHYDAFETPGAGNRLTAKDFNDDILSVTYAERMCPDHGREGAFFFQVNGDDPVIIPATAVGPILAFLVDRARFSQRKD